MIIKINGKNEDVGKHLDLASLISHRNLAPEHVIVEHNFNIVPREQWSSISLNDNDSVEIISFVGGG